MSINKHQIFKVKISDDEKFTTEASAEKALNTFLAEPNHVYLNHSITTITEDIAIYGSYKTTCKFLIISLIYKDLSSSNMDVTNASKKIKVVVHKQIENSSEITEPSVETSLDKEVKELLNSKK